MAIETIESAWQQLGKLDAWAKLELLQQFRSEQPFIACAVDVLLEELPGESESDDSPLLSLALLIWHALSRAKGPLNPVQPEPLQREFTRNAACMRENAEAPEILQGYALEKLLGKCRQRHLLAFVSKVLLDRDSFEVSSSTCATFYWLKAFIDTLDKVHMRKA